ENIVIDATNSTIEITNPCTKLDLGGIAKGYAAEQVAQYLENKGTQYAIVNPGGNIRTINTRADGNPWNIAIQKPTFLQDDGNIDVLSIPESMSMVTSGDYQRAYENEDGLRLHHLIDPDTLMPIHYFRSVTVITKNSMVADFFSTQLFLIPYQQGVELIHQYNQQHPQEPLHALWIIDDETITQHEDFFTVDEVDYQISMTENLQPYSRQYQKHHD
ncbi:MAG TPA: FAD:protein FMN transferase, partial [Erysipelothrix sp.]|nr:FAD:protein FMN transferase [Erysipelothrix sp.]